MHLHVLFFDPFVSVSLVWSLDRVASHLVDGVGVEEEFKVHLDIGDQQFACLEGWQMGTDEEGVPMLV